ncbi:hypothetical protein SAMN03159353_11172 [Cedecea sp. NFIX57]|nr:hypothetical protein SAMN03159353_11172 [Cedecea sp. NFIX57]
MPQRGMEAPAVVKEYSGGKGRRNPAKPVTQLIDFTNRPTHPAQPDPLKAIQKLLCAVGAYLRVSGPAGPLTGVYATPSSHTSQSNTSL